MNPHSYRLKGRDFVHQGKIEIDVNERAVFIRTQGCFFVYTNSDCFLNRLGNGAYDYVSLGDNEVPEFIPKDTELKEILLNDIDGFKPSPYGLYETAATVNNSWGYCAWDQNWKSAKKIADIKHKLNNMGINYLLNVGPDGLGRIPAECRKILQNVAKYD